MSYRRLVVEEYGGLEALTVIEEEALPQPGPGQVRVKSLASGVAFTDVMIRNGVYPGVKEKPPFTPGYDLVGEVDSLGEGVTRYSIGDRVAELTVIGAQAEYVLLDSQNLVPVPRRLDPAAAVSLVLSYTTAYQMLTRKAEAAAGERILVHGAGGAVGTALVQLGKHLQLEVYGTASPEKHNLVRRLGAVPINYQQEDFREVIRALDPPGVDAVFDHIGGDHFKRSFRSLRHGGTLVAYGFYNAAMGRGGSNPFDFLRLMLWNLLPNRKSASLYSIQPWREKYPDWFAADLSALFQLADEGMIDPVIWKKISLDEVPQAHRWIEQADAEGKIVCVFE